MKIISTILSEVSEITQTKKDLRNFGIVFSCVFLIVAAVVIYKRGYVTDLGYVFFGLAALFLLLGYLLPKVLKIPHKLWMIFAVILGFFMSRVILVLAFIIVIIPMGLLLKVLRKDILHLKIETDKSTFWDDYNQTEDKERYTKMY